jgi:late competence protein required for DNA uptake (superfamily II DNA/RNA helicase)
MKTLLILSAVFATIQMTEASVVCHTPRFNKVFEVQENRITFFNENDSTAKRELASVVSRSKITVGGVTQIVNFENQKHTIHIDDLKNFSDVNDYIIIKAKSGHETTYPITCELK